MASEQQHNQDLKRIQSNPAISNSVNSKSPLFRTKFEFPWIYPYVFSHYYQLFRTRLFRIPRYFELIVLSLHLKSTPLFRTCQKQSVQEETPKRPTKREVRQAIETLSRYSLFAIERAEIRGQTSHSCHSRSTKVLEKTKSNRTFKDFSMRQQLLIYPTYNYCIFI